MDIRLRYYCGALADETVERLEYLILYETDALAQRRMSEKMSRSASIHPRWMQTIHFSVNKEKGKDMWTEERPVPLPAWLNTAMLDSLPLPNDYGWWIVAIVSSRNHLGFFGNRTAGYAFVALSSLCKILKKGERSEYVANMLVPSDPYHSDDHVNKGRIHLFIAVTNPRILLSTRFDAATPFDFSRENRKQNGDIMMQQILRNMSPFMVPNSDHPLMGASTHEAISMHSPIVSLPTGFMPSAYYVDPAVLSDDPVEGVYVYLADIAMQRAGADRSFVLQLLETRSHEIPALQKSRAMGLLRDAMRALGIFCTLLPNAMIYIADFVYRDRRDSRTRRTKDTHNMKQLRSMKGTQETDLWENPTLMGSGDCDEVNGLSHLLGPITLMKYEWNTRILRAFQRLTSHYISLACICTVSKPALDNNRKGAGALYVGTEKYTNLEGGGHFTHLMIPTIYFEQCVGRANPTSMPLRMPYEDRLVTEQAWWVPYLEVITCEGTGKLDPLQLPPSRVGVARSLPLHYVDDTPPGRDLKRAIKAGSPSLLADASQRVAFMKSEEADRIALSIAYAELGEGLASYWSAYLKQPAMQDETGLSLSEFYREFTHCFSFQPRQLMTSGNISPADIPVEFLWTKRDKKGRGWVNGVNYRDILLMDESVILVSVPGESFVEGGVLRSHLAQRSPVLHPRVASDSPPIQDNKTIMNLVRDAGLKTAPNLNMLPKPDTGCCRVMFYAKASHLRQLKNSLQDDLRLLFQKTRLSHRITQAHVIVQPIADFSTGKDPHLHLEEVCLAVDVKL